MLFFFFFSFFFFFLFLVPSNAIAFYRVTLVIIAPVAGSSPPLDSRSAASRRDLGKGGYPSLESKFSPWIFDFSWNFNTLFYSMISLLCFCAILKHLFRDFIVFRQPFVSLLKARATCNVPAWTFSLCTPISIIFFVGFYSLFNSKYCVLKSGCLFDAILQKLCAEYQDCMDFSLT